MGCDIHVHVELKINGKWEHYSAPRFPRLYGLFAVMAGVRNYNDIEPVSEPRGLPDDMSLLTKLCYEKEELDAHSESWLNSKEWSYIIDTYLERKDHYLSVESRISYEHDFFGYLCGNGWDIKYKEDFPEFMEDYRLVFWFDN